jgi:oligoribonuclease NrnB/cAMP/cGMP phosphodiesterase (DHH superfamily)
MNKEPIVVSHTDLDGVVSYIVLCWARKQKLKLVGTTPKKLQNDIPKLLALVGEDTPLYILDLDVSKVGQLIDRKNVVIFDHHKTNIYPYKYASVEVTEYTSCAKLIYDRLIKNNSDVELTKAQKTLIALTDDWDSATKATSLSEDLNIVYHNTKNKIDSFIADYYDGFKPFDKFKTNIIALYKKHRAEYIKTLSPFFGNVVFEDEPVKVGAVFCNEYVAECCDYLFEKYNVDVSIAVMVEQQRIAVRRNANNDKVDVSKFVQRIANGGGHAAAAGGSLTEEFIEFTKMLKPLD